MQKRTGMGLWKRHYNTVLEDSFQSSLIRDVAQGHSVRLCGS